MWLLVVALVMLVVSAFELAFIWHCQSSYRARWERPPFYNRHEVSLFFSWLGLFAVGIVLVFIVAGWKWGLGGIAVYWVVTGLVLQPLVGRAVSGH